MAPVWLSIIFSLLFSVQSFSAEITQSPEPKLSQIKKMSALEVENALREYIGKKDSWRKKSFILTRIKDLIPFRKQLTAKEEAVNLSYIHARKSPKALRDYILTAQQSKHHEVQATVAIVRGEKRLAFESYQNTKNSNLKTLLFFFKNLDYGDTGFESKKFTEFVFAFDELARTINQAYTSAQKLNIPVVLEFESSALLPKSPLTRLFLNTLLSHPERILKSEVTPDGGRIVSLHPFYAKTISEGVSLFAEQFHKRVKLERHKLSSDRALRQSLVDLLRYGEGTSGILYTDEKIVELVMKADDIITVRNCSTLFN